MENYIFNIFIITAVLSILFFVTQEKFRQFASSLFTVMLLCVLLQPLPEMLANFKSMDFSLTIDEGEKSEQYKVIFENAIRAYLAEELGVKEECIEVEAVEFDFSSMTAKETIVTLHGGGIFANAQKIKALLDSENFGEVEVKYEI